MCFKEDIRELKDIRGSKVIPVSDDGYIYWHILEDRITEDMDKMKVVMSFENGFKILEKYFYPIQFKSTTDKSLAPILIGFYNNDTFGLPRKFEIGVLAYAFANFDNFKYASDMYFNDSYQWSEMNKPSIFNLCKTFVHECLHALGFDHSDNQEDILYWQYQPNDEINFSEDTQAAIKTRYAGEMAKIKGIAKEEIKPTELMDFIKSGLNLKANINLFNGTIIVNLCNFFNIPIKGQRVDQLKKSLITKIYG